MNLNPLYELKERLESSVIAGVSLLSEDFRLARAVEQMEPLSKASPVFSKIYQSSRELLSETCTNKEDTLLDILAFVEAVLTTQAVSSVEGELKPLPATEGKAYSDAPYSLLAPILEALTTSGSGHYSLIVETHDRNPEIFSDYRLKTALVAGLNAGYSELAERIEEWLSAEDASILPLLKKDFNPKGKKEMVRRIHVIEAIAGAKENAWFLSVLDQAEKEVRAAIIYALCHSQENTELLMGLTKTEKGNCKKAAMWALARMENTENREFWEGQIKKNPATATTYLALSTNDEASDLTADAILCVRNELQAQADSGNTLISDENLGKLRTLFESMTGKASPKMLNLYREIASDNLFESLKTEKNKPIQFETYIPDKHTVVPVSHYIAERLTDSMIWSMDKRLFELAEELYQTYGNMFIKPALTAALLTKPKEEVFDTFAVLLIKEGILSKENEQQKLQRQEIMDTFARVVWSTEQQEYEFCGCYYDGFKDKQIYVKRSLYEKPDIRWFELFVNTKLKKSGTFCTYHHGQYPGYTYYTDWAGYSRYSDWDSVLTNLLCPSDRESCEILKHYFHLRLLASVGSDNDKRYFSLLNRCGFMEGQGLVVKSLEKRKVQYWVMEDMIKEAPMPLADKLKELEEIKSLVAGGKINITGWSDERYQDLYDSLSVKLENEQKGVS
ncbi:MAG: hypothetical protein HFI34_05845 [Lachnospiraceae bacterium]|nr:hypothetical protein [Lachnospiraceae bacterium]